MDNYNNNIIAVKKPFFSIISVSRNCKDVVRPTIESVLHQKDYNLEYIIVDGMSDDGTYELERELLADCDRVQIIHERDDGIYDAMNKGVRLSNGSYICFLNMGDVFYDNSILSKVKDYLENNNIDILFGDVVTGRRVSNPERINGLMFLRERTICHQAIFSRRECNESNPFDLEYKICADRKWLYENYKKKRTIKHINVTTVKYDMSGVSQDKARFEAESKRLVKEQFGIFGVLFVDLKRVIRLLCH